MYAKRGKRGLVRQGDRIRKGLTEKTRDPAASERAPGRRRRFNGAGCGSGNNAGVTGRDTAMNPSRFSLRYPTVTVILTAQLVIVGMRAFFHMQRTEDTTRTIRTGAGGSPVSGRHVRTGGKSR